MTQDKAYKEALKCIKEPLSLSKRKTWLIERNRSLLQICRDQTHPRSRQILSQTRLATRVLRLF